MSQTSHLIVLNDDIISGLATLYCLSHSLTSILQKDTLKVYPFVLFKNLHVLLLLRLALECINKHIHVIMYRIISNRKGELCV